MIPRWLRQKTDFAWVSSYDATDHPARAPGRWRRGRPAAPVRRPGRARRGRGAVVRALALPALRRPKPRLTERELDHLVAVDHHGSEALVAFDPATGRGVAVARYAPVPGAPRVADVAVTVADEWQGRGLGTALLARLVARARAEGHVALRASVLAVNRASLALLRRAGFRLRENGGTLLELELDLGAVATAAA